MRRAVWTLFASIASLLAGLTICLPGICGCVPIIPGVDGDRYFLLALVLDVLGLMGILASILWIVAACLRTQRPPRRP